MDTYGSNLTDRERRTLAAVGEFGKSTPRRLNAPPGPPPTRPGTAQRLVRIVSQMAADVRSGADVEDIGSRLDGLERFFESLLEAATGKVKEVA